MENIRKHICIHGHFYQPPRENAWLEIVEQQEGAAPFHDWNERITYECYGPNATARILNKHNEIIKIVNNFENISFNFGPTLLSWMERANPATYQRILQADTRSTLKYKGHGNALAQSYNHLIMPLATHRDKKTQIHWGIRDFEYRFKRMPEGMWLPETAVDTETLELMAEAGIKFTVLAPSQAKAIRKAGKKEWKSVQSGDMQVNRPYQCNLPSGKSVALYFYNGRISQDIAFDGLLDSGKSLANRLLSAFDDSDAGPELVHVATDGETYGHHHRFGEMALADCMNYLVENELAKFTNYAQYLTLQPLIWEAQIHENSSWSCPHGVERWRSDCGCSTGGKPEWNQRWRAPLRQALDNIRTIFERIFEEYGTPLFHDVWAARDGYIDVILDRNKKSEDKFFKKYSTGDLTDSGRTLAFRLLEMQRHAMLMYTSCGWFFNEVSGIETIQILQYAHRAIGYAEQISGKDYLSGFMQDLAGVPSNIYENGVQVYKKYVLPARVSLERVAMHFAAASLFDDYSENPEFFNYKVENQHFEKIEAGLQKLVVGRTRVRSKITNSKKEFSFAVVYLGQHHLIGDISLDMLEADFLSLSENIITTFKKGNLGEVLRLQQYHFTGKSFTLKQLFADEQQRIIKRILEQNLHRAESDLRNIYKDNYQLMSDFLEHRQHIPEAFLSAVAFVVNRELQRFFSKEKLKEKSLARLSDEIQKWQIALTELPRLELEVTERIFLEIQKLAAGNFSLSALQNLNNVVALIQDIGIPLDLYKSQNIFYEMLQGQREGKWNFSSSEWKSEFYRLGKQLKIMIATPATLPEP